MSINKVVFAVDDDMIMHRVYQEILDEHYNLHCFSGAQEMLQMLDSVQPELVIIDIGLAGMSGYELCEAFKHKKGMAAVPVVFVTGHDFSQDKGRAFFSGGSEYVTKPIEEAQFNRLIKKLIEDHQTILVGPEGK